MSKKGTSTRSSRASTRAKLAAKEEAQELVETRLLFVAFGVGILATLLFLIAFSGEYWVYVTLSSLQGRNDTSRGGQYLKIGHYHGIWKICRQEYWYVDQTASNDTYFNLFCRPMYFSLPDYMKQKTPKVVELEGKMLHFRRSTAVIGFIALLLSIVAHVFSWYSMAQLRYVFKRLTGCLHLITSACCWVTIEVFRQSIKFEKENMKENVPEFSEVKHGWCYNLVWVTIILFLLPGVIFLALSRKRKGRKARSVREAHENEPVQLGRF